MAVLIGQVYYPKFSTKVEEGVEKSKFMFSLATRKAFIEDTTKPNLFTQCVVYQSGLAKILAEHFGKDEHNGKGIVLYGHFNDYTWNPDPANTDHDKFWQSVEVTRELLDQAGIKLAADSAQSLTIQVPITQTTRQFVVTGFEFAESSSASRSASKTPAAPPTVRVGNAPAPSMVPASDTDRPF